MKKINNQIIHVRFVVVTLPLVEYSCSEEFPTLLWVARSKIKRFLNKYGIKKRLSIQYNQFIYNPVNALSLQLFLKIHLI
jgi:hypothetical protein